MSVNSRLKATKIIGQRKAFYRQKIPESSCMNINMRSSKHHGQGLKDVKKDICTWKLLKNIT